MIPIPNTMEVISRIAMSSPATIPPVFEAAETIHNSSCHTLYYIYTTLYTLTPFF